MNKSQLRFQPENFVVHYITLNLRETVEKENLHPIAKYLSGGIYMKFSKSILFFLFVTSSVSAFYYALKRTNGNVYQSIMFTMYFLGIQIGFIAPNHTPKLNQDHPNPQILSRVIESPGYHPYLTVYNDYRPSGLLMGSIEVPQYSYSQNVINELRAGSRSEDLKQTAHLLVSIWYAYKLQQSYGFQKLPNQVQMPHLEAAHNLLFGKPKSDGQSRLHLSNSNQISTNVMPTQIQAAKFVKKDGSIDLQQAFDEVNRRASVIGCGNFDCSFERFKNLATECSKTNTQSTREAITILEGEMRGYYRNSRREDYGPNVTGLDFVTEGLGEFDHITHVEVKGAVSSSIRPKPTLVKQAKKYVNRVNYQKNFWSDETAVKKKIPHINPDADLPKSRDNVLGLYDLWDVGTLEKSTVSNAITALSGNDTNIIFLNNITNT